MQGNMTRAKLKKLLECSMLFTAVEIRRIFKQCTQSTLGHVIVACNKADIGLDGNDIDILINTLFFDEDV